MRVFFSAGEASGDACAASLVQALDSIGALSHERMAKGLVRQTLEDCKGDAHAAASDLDGAYGVKVDQNASTQEWVDAVSSRIASDEKLRSRLREESLLAVAGAKTSQTGVALIVDSRSWGTMGIAESALGSLRVIEGYFTAKSLLRVSGPGVFVPIDFGFFNIKLCKVARQHGWKILYFAPPGSWRKDKQGADLPNLCDSVVCQFPWSAEILKGMGADSHYFGHPLWDTPVSSESDTSRDGIAVLPGSRKHEIKHNIPVIAEALAGSKQHIRLSVAPNLDQVQIERQWVVSGGPPATIVSGAKDALSTSRAAIVCSGTATLEAAYHKCPSVVVYRVSPLMKLEYLLRRPKFDFISLPNIVLGRGLVPELIQDAASPEAIRDCLAALIADGPTRDRQMEGFDEIECLLGQKGCFAKTAKLIESLNEGLSEPN